MDNRMKNTTLIENRNDIVRDNHSKAILKTDIEEKKSWLLRKERNNKIINNENEINKIRDEVQELKSILNEIKDILKVNE
tara:strand:- start:221 stop:460 length:240 start_codon:yes stop_codon:yes gene_type:complete